MPSTNPGPRSARLAAVLVMAVVPPVWAQDSWPAEVPTPLFAGVAGYQSTFTPGMETVSPEIDPILLVPLGNKVLFETELEVRLDLAREDGLWEEATVDWGVEYMQLDYLAHRNLTVAAGRFLTPFGIYRERIHPIWIRNLATEPIIFALNATSSNGAMLRGAARLGSPANLTYAGYYSFPVATERLQSVRQTGGRTSLFVPGWRLEVGFSFNRELGEEPHNTVGGDLTWNLKPIPLDLRGEAIRNPLDGSGYWLEGALRLTRSLHLVVRGEQFWIPQHGDEEGEVEVAEPGHVEGEEAASGDEHGLPDRDTSRFSVGGNLYFAKGFRLAASYGRNLAEGQDYNIWSAGITYRFALQLR